MARRIPISERAPLFRDPADWARDWGWLSPKKAENRARELREIAEAIRGALGETEDDNAGWPESLEAIADKIDPATAIAATRRRQAVSA